MNTCCNCAGSSFDNSDYSDSGMVLAMAYVPIQIWKQVYDLPIGFKTGTIFPDLDKPYTGRRECV